MIDLAGSLVGDLIDLGLAVAGLLAVLMILRAYAREQTIQAVVGAIILAGVVVFAVFNVGWLRERVAEDVGAAGRAPAVWAAPRLERAGR